MTKANEMFQDRNRVGTGSDSDLVCDQPVKFPSDLIPTVDQVATAPCTDPIQESRHGVQPRERERESYIYQTIRCAVL